ncbi:MAG: hypothetical protein HY675_20290 [Chloroflexi bacterium]|nr:hypothetical protein [Chloroflexota bacterium]
MIRDSVAPKRWQFIAAVVALMAVVSALFARETSGHVANKAVAHQQPEIPAWSGEFLTINVEMTDDGLRPSSISIPEGKRVQLLVRNFGQIEHHFHIQGLVPKDMLWLATGRSEAQVGGDSEPDEHASHHGNGGQLVPFHTCTSGICPTGNAVHAHADPGEIDVVWFIATNKGTFEVVDALSPEQIGSVTVY